jgi:hypothetical protein
MRGSVRDWYGLAMLAAEVQQVMWLRMMRLGAGGRSAEREASRMVSEKFTAAAQASALLMRGGTPDGVVKGYRRKVRANLRRLSK